MLPSSNGFGTKRRLNFELNLIPFVDVLSVCICFLLMTAVYLQLGTVNVHQALGDGAGVSEEKLPPTLSVQVSADSDVILQLKNIKGSLQKNFVVASQDRQIDWSKALGLISQSLVKNKNIQTAMILPASNTKYQDVIRLMDEVKNLKVANVGIAPL